MSSRIFEARTSNGACALSARPIAAGTRCFYLTCLGQEARPGQEVEASSRDDDYSTGFRTVPAGWTTTGRGRNERRKRVFAWEQRADDGRWHRVDVWEQMVTVDAARELGYRVPTGETRAERGKRTQGYAHRLAPDETVGTDATPAPSTPAPTGDGEDDDIAREIAALEARRAERTAARRREADETAAREAREAAARRESDALAMAVAVARAATVEPAIPAQPARRNPMMASSYFNGPDAAREREQAVAARETAAREARETAARNAADARPRGATGYREPGPRLLDLD